MDEPEAGTQRRASGFLSLPSTNIGTWSAGLVLLSLVMILLNNLVAMPVTEQRTSLELAQRVLNLTVFLGVAVAGVTGLFAVVMKRERSWAVLVAIVLFIVALGLNLAPYLHAA